MRVYLVLILIFISKDILSQNFYNNRKDLVEITYKKKKGESDKQAEKNALEKLKNFAILESINKVANKNIDTKNYSKKAGDKIKSISGKIIEISKYYSKWDNEHYNIVCRVEINKQRLEKQINDILKLLNKKKITPKKEVVKKEAVKKDTIVSTISKKTIVKQKNLEDNLENLEKLAKMRTKIGGEKLDLKSKIKDYKKKINIYDKEILKDNENAEAYYSKGLILFISQEYDEADKYFSRAIIVDSTYTQNTPINFYIGFSNFKLKNYERAIENFIIREKYNANNTELYYYSGVIYDIKKKYSLAIYEYTKAINSDTKFIKGYVNRCASFLEIGHLDKASKDADSACKLGNCKMKTTLQELGLYDK